MKSHMVWIETTRPHYDRSDLKYSSNCSDEEREIITPFLQVHCGRGRPLCHDLRHIWDAINYIAASSRKSLYRFCPFYSEHWMQDKPVTWLLYVMQGGNPITNYLLHAFRKACRKADVKKSSHRVRKISATRAANADATIAQLKALFGWKSDQMASLYTREADQSRLAKDSIEKLQG